MPHLVCAIVEVKLKALERDHLHLHYSNSYTIISVNRSMKWPQYRLADSLIEYFISPIRQKLRFFALKEATAFYFNNVRTAVINQ